MKTEIILSVKQGSKTVATMFEFAELDYMALARVENATHDLNELVEYLARASKAVR